MRGRLQPFGDANARNLSAACEAYITKDAISSEDLTQTQLQAQVNGELFDLGAGTAQLALLADYRRNTYAYAPDTDVTRPSGWAAGPANIEAWSQPCRCREVRRRSRSSRPSSTCR